MKFFNLLLLMILTTFSLFAQPKTSEQILTTSGGNAVSIDGDWTSVGDVSNAQIRMFQLNYDKLSSDPANMWEIQQTLSRPSTTTGAFGSAVSIAEKTVVVTSPSKNTWQMEMGVAQLRNTTVSGQEVYDVIPLQQNYDVPPLIFALTDQRGGQPAAVRIRNITTISFEMAVREPENDGKHLDMQVPYIAISRGEHVMIDQNGDPIKIVAGEHNTTTAKDNSANPGNSNFDTVNFSSSFNRTPMMLAMIQTQNSETVPEPTASSSPWMTAALNNIASDSFDISLERAGTADPSDTILEETIGYLAIETLERAGNIFNRRWFSKGTFKAVDCATNIDFQLMISGNDIGGWDGSCNTVDFAGGAFSSTPLVVATKNSYRNNKDGGWLRRCSSSSSSIGLKVDEDVGADGDRDRSRDEKVGLFAFSQAFATVFNADGTQAGQCHAAYIYDFDGTNWNEKQIIDVKADENRNNTAVAVQSDGTNAQIAVGAPNAVNTNGNTGKAYTYSWDGTTLTSGTVLSGGDYAKSYGASIDMKDDHLIVGAPDSEQPGLDNHVGSAYTYSLNSSAWVEYPSATYFRIKRNITNEKLGTQVAIGNGNAIVSTAPSASDGSWRYEVGVVNSQLGWLEKTHFYQGIVAHGVDMEDNISMSTSSTDKVRFYINDLNHTKYGSYSDMEVTTSTTAGALDSVQLYKDQIVVSDPGNDQAVAIDVPCGIRPTELKKNEWAMISIPCGDGTASIGALFNGQLGGTYGDSGTWVMYEQNSTDYSGTSGSMQIMGVNDPMKLGKGYWIITDQDRLLEAKSITTRTDSTDDNVNDGTSGIPNEVIKKFFSLSLATGVTTGVRKIMVGNTYARTFQWENVYYAALGGGMSPTPINDPSLANYIKPNAYVYDTTQTASTGQPYRSITANTPGFKGEIKPYQAFWVELPDTNSDSLNALYVPFEK